VLEPSHWGVIPGSNQDETPRRVGMITHHTASLPQNQLTLRG